MRFGKRFSRKTDASVATEGLDFSGKNPTPTPHFVGAKKIEKVISVILIFAGFVVGGFLFSQKPDAAHATSPFDTPTDTYNKITTITCGKSTYGSGLCGTSSSWKIYAWSNNNPDVPDSGKIKIKDAAGKLYTSAQKVKEVNEYGPGLPKGSGPAFSDGQGRVTAASNQKPQYAGHISWKGFNNSNVWTGSGDMRNAYKDKSIRWISWPDSDGNQTTTNNLGQAQYFLVGETFTVNKAQLLRDHPNASNYYLKINGLCVDDSLAKFSINGNSTTGLSSGDYGNFWNCKTGNSITNGGLASIDQLNNGTDTIYFWVYSEPAAWGLLIGQIELDIGEMIPNWSVQTHSIARVGDTASDVAKNSFPTNSASLPFGNTVNAYPGQFVSIGHYAQQNGPAKTNTKVSFSFDHTNSPTAFNWGSTSASWTSGAVPSPVNYPGAPTVETNPKTIQSDQAGNTYCSQFVANPWSSADSSIKPYEGAAACVHVPYNYHITVVGVSNNLLNVNSNTGECVSSGNIGASSSVNFNITAASGKLNNGYNATISKTISWRVVNLNTGAVIENTHANGTNLAGSQTFTPGQVVNVAVSIAASNTVGAATQYALEITDNGNWSTGASVETLADVSNSHTASTDCKMVFGKSPSIQLDGADSFAQDGFQGSMIAHVPTNGSWSQYAELANGSISNFGSAGFISNGDKNSCKLWFANTANSGSDCLPGSSVKGNVNFSRNVSYPPINKTVAQSDNPTFGSAPASWQGGPLWAGTYCPVAHVDLGYFQTPGTYAYTGNVQISGGGNFQGPCTGMFGTRAETSKIHGNYIIYVKGDITIADNINLDQNNGDTSNSAGTTKFAKLADIPQFTIYATGNININYNVSRIDANLLSANGTVNDCANSSDLSENGGCSTQLVVNGAIASAKSPRFTRTYGAEDGGTAKDNCGSGNVSMSTPAECIVYNPNLFLVPFANSQASGSGGSNWQTTAQTSLPARY